MPSINVKSLVVSYDLGKGESEQALKGVSVLFPSGRFCLLSGPSGSGKSTLLKTLSGLLPYDGTILWGDKDFASMSIKDLKSAYVGQDVVLYPKKDVFFNLSFPLLIAKKNKDEIREEVISLAKELGISHCLARGVEELSYGQQQLVTLGKSLIKKPEVILLDEPFSALDPVKRNSIGLFLKDWGQKSGATIIYVGHSPSEALRLADYFCLLEQGSLAFAGTLQDLKASPLKAAQEFYRLGGSDWL